MRRGAGLLLAAACAAALWGACARRPPAAGAALVERPFAASFSASASGEAGRLRFSGILAAAPGGRLRVEIAGGGESFILVSGEDELSAVLSRGRLLLREGRDSDLVGRLTGIGITAPQISSLLLGDPARLPPGCRATSRRWRSAGRGALLATRLSIRCDGETMKISLSDLVLLEEERARRAFAPLPGDPGHRRVDSPAMARALAGALSGGEGPGAR